MHASRARRARALAWTLGALWLVVGVTPSSAKILKTRSPGQAGHALALTVGNGFEYQTDPEESEFGFPFLLEYAVTHRLTFVAEPSFVSIHSRPGQRGASVHGAGDFETTLDYELVSERRHRPALAAEAVIKWPTASHPTLGTKQTDYSLGVIASKAFVHYDLEFNALYTWVGSPAGTQLPNSMEFSMASELHLRRSLDLELEVVTTSAGGGFRGTSGSIGGFGGIPGSAAAARTGGGTAGTIGLAEHLNHFLKLEEGLIAGSDGSWQFVFAWEWDFSGGR